MAKTAIKRIGYGQVEPNHLSAQRNGQIYAQLPAKSNITQLENGQFVKYDYENGEVNLTGAGEWLLVFNEIKNYAADKQGLRFFAQKKSDAVDGVITPRCFATHVGDIYTTNCLGGANTSADAEYAGLSLEVGSKLVIDNTTGFLVEADPEEEPTGQVWVVVKVYTVPDGVNPGVKLQRIQ